MKQVRSGIAGLIIVAAVAGGCSLSQGAAISPQEAAERGLLPSKTPDRIILTWNGDPPTSQAVTWRTSVAVPAGVGQIAEAEPGSGFDPYGGEVRPNPQKVRTVTATTRVLSSDLGDAHYHEVTFRGLKPRTKYVYRVGDGELWSAWFQFSTPSDRPDEVRFIYFGDSQNEHLSHWSRVVRQAFSDMPKAHFLLHAGDLASHARSDAQWGEWHAAGGWINAMVPSIPTPGNHEYFGGGLTKHWRSQFTLPENGPEGLEETAYYVDVQGVRIVSLNSNENLQEQAEWLDELLSDNPNAWTVITFHHPVYSTALGRDNAALRAAWRPVFDEHVPDLVLQGHDHTYGRAGPMREDNLLTGAQTRSERGTVYVVSVSGPKMYELEGAEWMNETAQGVQLYQLITIRGGSLHYEARTADGALFDTFEIVKPVGEVEPATLPKGASPPVSSTQAKRFVPVKTSGFRVTRRWLGVGVAGMLAALVAVFFAGRGARR